MFRSGWDRAGEPVHQRTRGMESSNGAERSSAAAWNDDAPEAEPPSTEDAAATAEEPPGEEPQDPIEHLAERATALLPAFQIEADEILGQGAFSVVLHAQHIPTKNVVALKLTDKRNLDPKVLHRVRTEAKLLEKPPKHRNIVRCFGGAVEDDSVVALILSRESGQSLAKIVNEDGPMDDKDAAPICLQLVRALKHCHSRKIAHRDVKLENVVLDEESGRAVLVDFGLALAVRTAGSRLDVKCGSPEYYAPELLRLSTLEGSNSNTYYGPAVDMWALGVTIYTLMCGQFPFGRTQTKICRGQYDKAALDSNGVGEKARDFVANCLVVDPNSAQRVNRLNSTDACKHAWFAKLEGKLSEKPPKSLPEESKLVAAVQGAAAAAAGGGSGGRTSPAEEEDTEVYVSTPRGFVPEANKENAPGVPDLTGAEAVEAEATHRLLELSDDLSASSALIYT